MVGTTAAVGFGSSATGIQIIGGIIDTTNINNFAFSMPRDGIIRSLAAYFSVDAGISLIGTTVQITAQLYSASSFNNQFTAIPGAVVDLTPALTGVISIGDRVSGITTGLAIPVAAETRLLLIFSVAVITGAGIATTLVGYASAGLGIE
ncbi:hypothetical protein bsdcttw_34100 [Anaerocolumna chitinilytica]|uniref:BclB domain-containing protein n=1 Tax=Anaerocolumna chitinilytica TaxID=1727145 RepID=A0A7I8DPQ2_9FIRM|nr:hypothetical protein bsdcttw_34100 [Anaerocolumna chitinilytica]